MIVFDLRCDPAGHVFEAWFGSSEDYESQSARGLVSCPVCGSAAVGKAPMAPRVGAKGNMGAGSSAGAEMKAALSRIAELQKVLLDKSDFVGERFPEEARAIHLGEAEARAIHGNASPGEAKALIDEGIEVTPLPLPVVPPGTKN